MFTDVSGSIGYEAVYGSKWFVEYSLDIHANYHIFIKGLFHIVLLNEIFGTHLSNNFFFCRFLSHTFPFIRSVNYGNTVDIYDFTSVLIALSFQMYLW